MATKQITVWFVGGHSWSYTCPAAEANLFVAYASNATLEVDSMEQQQTRGGIYQPPSAPGRYIVWRNLTDFTIS